MPTSLPRMPLCIPTPSISPFRLTLAPSLGTISTSKSHPIGYSNRKGVGFGWRNREKKVFVGINGVNSCSGASENGSVKKRSSMRLYMLRGAGVFPLPILVQISTKLIAHTPMLQLYASHRMWRHKFQPITKKALVIYFSVDPVGTQLM